LANRRKRDLLASYPRSRRPLTPAHQAGYVEFYRHNRAGASGLARVVSGLEGWMHRRVARRGGSGALLEIGAGNLNHVRFEPAVEPYDVVEPFHELWHDSPYRGCIRHFFDDVADVPAGVSYQRIVSVAALEHLTHLPWVVARSAVLLTPDGTFRAGIPSEGGLLWGLAWRSTTGLAYRLRTGLDFETLIQHEHLSRADEILEVVGYFFGRLLITRFPLPSHHLSLYTYLEAHEPRLDRCRSFLGSE
jgi:hypothetical protein